MNSNQLMTMGAIGFAVFAAVTLYKQPGRTIGTSAGQQQRDAGLSTWVSSYNGNFAATISDYDHLMRGDTITLSGWKP